MEVEQEKEDEGKDLPVDEQQVQEPSLEDVRNTEAEALRAAFEYDATAEEQEERLPYTEKQIEMLGEKLGVSKLAEKLAEIDRLRVISDKVSGRIGSLYQTVDALRKLQQSTAAVTPSVPPQEVEASMKELEEDYPELAQSLLPILKGLATQRPASEPTPAEPIFRLDPVEAKKDELTLLHEDWQDIVQTPQFKAWKEALPPARRRIAEESWSVPAVAQILDEYKASRKRPPENRKESRTSRLAAAITPSGKSVAGQVEMTLEEAFLAGFKGA